MTLKEKHVSGQMRELAERCEAATGPDRVTDIEIYLAVHGDRTYGAITGNKHQIIGWGTLSGYLDTYRDVINADDTIEDDVVPYYTKSIDAAMSLVPEGYDWQVDGAGLARVCHNHIGDAPLYEARAATPALALCAAALRAISTLREQTP